MDEILAHGKGICSGYLPVPGGKRYLEIWEHKGVVYMIVANEDGRGFTAHIMGYRWTEIEKGGAA